MLQKLLGLACSGINLSTLIWLFAWDDIFCTGKLWLTIGLNINDGPRPLDAISASMVRNLICICYSLATWPNSFGFGFSVLVKLRSLPLLYSFSNIEDYCWGWRCLRKKMCSNYLSTPLLSYGPSGMILSTITWSLPWREISWSSWIIWKTWPVPSLTDFLPVLGTFCRVALFLNTILPSSKKEKKKRVMEKATTSKLWQKVNPFNQILELIRDQSPIGGPWPTIIKHCLVVAIEFVRPTKNSCLQSDGPL